MSREAEKKLGSRKHMARTKYGSTSSRSICKDLESGVSREELAGRDGSDSVSCRITWQSCRARGAKDARFNGEKEA